MTNGSSSLRVVMFSVAPFLIPLNERWLNEKGHRLVGIVSAPGPRIRRTDDYLEVARYARPGVDVIISNYPSRWADMIRPLKPDLLVTVGFNWKIPADVLAVPRLGAINGHDAPLPRYRGRNATGWQLRNDEPLYGVSVHYMTPELDDGHVLSQRMIPISDDDENFPDHILPRFLAAVEEIFKEALDRIVAGDPGTPQDESQVTYAGGAFEPEWRFIDWSRPARDIFIQVRSWYGVRDVPLGALGNLDSHPMLITKTRLIGEPSSAREPGTILERSERGVLVQCGDRPLLIVNAVPASTEQLAAARPEARQAVR